MEPFVDANAVADYLKITRRQVLEMTRRGVFPGYPLGTGSRRRIWRYRLSEIDAAVASCAHTPRKAPSARVPSRVQLQPAVLGANGGNSNG
jgi:predicted DNA-binding transcriptional regulator AlpA